MKSSPVQSSHVGSVADRFLIETVDHFSHLAAAQLVPTLSDSDSDSDSDRDSDSQICY